MTIRDGILYVTKKTGPEELTISSVLPLSRISKIEIVMKKLILISPYLKEEAKNTLYILSYPDDNSQTLLVEKSYKCEKFNEFLDHLEESLESLNSPLKLPDIF